MQKKRDKKIIRLFIKQLRPFRQNLHAIIWHISKEILPLHHFQKQKGFRSSAGRAIHF
ncbi:MAG: hypothetical protein K0S31_4377 [Sphingobacterium multivorum]|nr:hypothetical protein [Sphingobacterium multivorum]